MKFFPFGVEKSRWRQILPPPLCVEVVHVGGANKRGRGTLFLVKNPKKSLERFAFPLRFMRGLALGVYGWVPVFKTGPLAAPTRGC